MTNLLISASLSSFFFGLFGVSWDAVDAKIAREYPAVQSVSATELQELFTRDAASAPLVFDVREPAEFAVSRLATARNLDSGAAIAAAVPDRDAPIVVYCSVGYRSARVANELQQLGFTNVRNMHHSLFGWANAGYPLVNANGDTSLVHPYNRAWGELLEPARHAYLP